MFQPTTVTFSCRMHIYMKIATGLRCDIKIDSTGTDTCSVRSKNVNIIIYTSEVITKHEHITYLVT
jgi:hypothetical protein